MKKRVTLNINAFMLLGLLALSVLVAYLPHHHHEGIVCMEQNDGFESHSTSDHECHLDNIEIENTAVSKERCTVLENSYLFTFLTLDLFASRKVIAVYAACEKSLDNQSYYSSSHKLRGSPFFS